jgi:hypothetical protein
MMSPDLLDRLSREDLVARAKALGAERPELMTRVELRDEIVRLSEPDETKRRQSRGWFGAARDLLASVVESGLHMPDAAALIRGQARLDANVGVRPPVATVTLAEIYAAQGHVDKALTMLNEVLEREPEHEQARSLHERLTSDSDKRRKGMPSVPKAEPDASRLEAAAAAEPPEVRPAPVEIDVEARAPAEALTDTSGPPLATAAVGLSDTPAEGDAVSLIMEGERLYVYWELSTSSIEQARKDHSDGSAVVRIVHFLPTWAGAQREEHDIVATTRQGFAVVVRRNSNAVVRAALGWRLESSFIPFAVATELTSTPESGADVRVEWAPPAYDAEGMAPVHRRALQKFFEQG